MTRLFMHGSTRPDDLRLAQETVLREKRARLLQETSTTANRIDG